MLLGYSNDSAYHCCSIVAIERLYGGMAYNYIVSFISQLAFPSFSAVQRRRDLLRYSMALELSSVISSVCMNWPLLSLWA